MLGNASSGEKGRKIIRKVVAVVCPEIIGLEFY